MREEGFSSVTDSLPVTRLRNGNDQMKRLILSVLLAIFSVAAMAQSTSNDTFTAASLYSACTHNVSDAKTKEDIEFIEQIDRVPPGGVARREQAAREARF